MNVLPIDENNQGETVERGANDWWPEFSGDEYRRRYAALRSAMAERGLDCLAVYGAPLYFGTDPGAPNLIYLSAYAPGLHGYVIFPREGDPTLATYIAGHLANAREMSVIRDVRGSADLPGMICDRVRELRCERGRIGIVGNFAWSNASIPLEHYQSLKANLPDATIEIVTSWYEQHRLAKSTEEIEFMAHGAAICDRAFDAVREMAAPGRTEAALQNEALRVVQAQGGRTAFGHVGSTAMREPKMTYPSFYSTNRVLRRGDAIMTELTGGYGGYFGKVYTTSFIGAPTREYRTMFELAADRYRDIVSAIKPGVSGRELARALSGNAEEAGFKSLSFLSGWSTYNTRPVLFSRRVEKEDLAFELQPGYCLNVAGWIVDKDERMGVWTGDTVIVTENGVRRLHRSPIDDLAQNVLVD